MGKRYGFITPGDMFSYYYNNEAVRWLTVLAAICTPFSIPGSSSLPQPSCSTGLRVCLQETIGLIFMAAIVWFYVVTGGLKASTWVGCCSSFFW